MAVYPYRMIKKNSEVSKVRKLNVDSTLVGFFHAVEYISRKFIVTALSISRRPPKERICFAGKSFLSEQIPLGRIASSREADKMSPNLSPLRSDDKIPLKSSDVSAFHKLSVDTTLSVEYCL